MRVRVTHTAHGVSLGQKREQTQAQPQTTQSRGRAGRQRWSFSGTCRNSSLADTPSRDWDAPATPAGATCGLQCHGRSPDKHTQHLTGAIFLNEVPTDLCPFLNSQARGAGAPSV